MKPPALKSIQFYDSHQNIVETEAGWYNAAGIDSILVQWEGNTPNNIKMFCTPTGTETYFELDYGNTVIVSEIYNIINEPDFL